MKRTFKTLLSDRRGLALITVVGTLALATILLMAIFSVTQTEYKATQSFVAAQSAKQLADAATAIVQAQIQNGQNIKKDNTRTTHATQPGCVRVYKNDGTFLEAYKLYSSSQMATKAAGAAGEKNLSEGKDSSGTLLLPLDWDAAAKSARYVDLNEPVVRPPLVAGPGVKPSIYFPIIDPRAAYNFMGSQTPAPGTPTTQVEGFSYSTGIVNGVVVPTAAGGDETKLRVPMPVEWIYLLQDGTMGTLDATNKFVSAAAGKVATVTNPIVGRIAFWADDESCKINVNTASEPTFAGSPYYFHDRDRMWAHFPALSSEYQRYQGHPATVALSTVLAPGYRLDTGYFERAMPPSKLDADGLTLQNVVDLKEGIYDLAPKIEKGGSIGGTKTYVRDDFDKGGPGIVAAPINTTTSRAERLYVSIDEMLFKDGAYNMATGRSASEFSFPGVGGRVLFDHDTLERSRFFLTAHSRAPEFSIHGLPRIAVWPIADEVKGPDLRTNFDNLIALCATLNNTGTGGTVPNSYIFRRSEPHHSSYDVTGTTAGFPNSNGLQRNRILLGYLEKQMTQLSFPRTSAIAEARNNFQQKYGVNNVRQLGVQIFDYIRCINLYDGMLARSNNGAVAAGMSGTALYNKTDTTPFKTFTNPRITTPATTVVKSKAADTGVMPGHGQVTPAVWDQGGISYRGFGRMFTISEVGLHVICTGDGKNDKYAVGAAGEFGGIQSGGASTARISESQTNYGQTNAAVYPGFTLPNGPNTARWYSNFPPLTGNPPPPLYGVQYTPANGPRHPSKHLGYNPEVWNYTLQANTPLLPDEKRVQAMLSLEAFCPMLGWTKFFPEFTVEVDGNFVAGIKINGQSLFNTTGSLYLKSNGNAYEVYDVHSVGGHTPPRALYEGRRSVAPGGPGVLMPSDPGYDSSVATKHSGLSNLSLTSQFITIKRDNPMDMTFPNQPLVIKIWDTHDISNPQKKVIQTISIQFPNTITSNKPPFLGGADDGSTIGDTTKFTFNFKQSVDASGRIVYNRSRQGPHWWCFNWGGCVDRSTGKVNPAYKLGGGPGPGPGPGGGSPAFWQSGPTLSLADAAGHQKVRGRMDSTAGMQAGAPPGGIALGVGLTPDDYSDVVRSMVPVMGDYRILAAMQNVPTSFWQPHPLSGNPEVRMAHNFTSFSGSTESGYKVARNPSNPLPTKTVYDGTSMVPIPTYFTLDRSLQLVAGALYSDGRQPDLPNDPQVAQIANSFGDFDTGIAASREGPYINKPDEGNYYANNTTRNGITRFYRSGYFYDSWQQSDDWNTGIFMTPNRMIASPVMFGSLPSAVWPGSTVPGSGNPSGLPSSTNYQPWQTLLFRPYVKNVAVAQTTHPGERNPQDHYLLDMFFMPVVEPYAISEPLSEAGKINMNYQMLPFSYIRRATGMHAVLKGEYMTAIPLADVNAAKGVKAATFTGGQSDEFWSDSNGNKYWHRPVDPVKTLEQFDERFNFAAGVAAFQKGLFRSASQICETFMIPKTALGPGDPVGSFGVLTAATRKTAMQTFWQNHAVTGENIRERPYSNIYSRVTTRSNTFRVHVRSQVIKKARSTDADTFDPVKDAVLSEYRGSTVLERFIDPTDTTKPLPDYAASAAPLSEEPLDTFYQFRTLETKRFAP